MRFDTLVIGSGIAGLFTALRATEHGSVALVTKAALEESNTRYAQGGIAAVMFDDDEVELHIADTLAAGAGLCDEDAVRVLCSEGPERIRELLRLGVEFDHNGNTLARGLEAAHSRSRVLHAGGDATGARIEAALAAAIRATGVTVLESTFLTDLIVEDGSVVGANLLRAGETFQVLSPATVIASGGAGRLYRHTTNPAVATGDGVAAAFRAGAIISDAEFFQFHPTASALPGGFLISEAVRGEGAVLRTATGERFTDELAPRDVVARAIAEQMSLQNGTPVLLDATALGAEFLAKRFPSIDAHCRAAGHDWSSKPVPVTPAAHYWMGGIRTDLFGRTSLAGLFAVGEAACTGVHGANRLASNSLLEGIVFAARLPLSTRAAAEFATTTDVLEVEAPAGSALREDLRETMWDNAGLVREASGLQVASKMIRVAARVTPVTQTHYEDRNLTIAGALVCAAALRRSESRGAHFRSDYPATSPEWQGHLDLRIAR